LATDFGTTDSSVEQSPEVGCPGIREIAQTAVWSALEQPGEQQGSKAGNQPGFGSNATPKDTDASKAGQPADGASHLAMVGQSRRQNPRGERQRRRQSPVWSRTMTLYSRFGGGRVQSSPVSAEAGWFGGGNSGTSRTALRTPNQHPSRKARSRLTQCGDAAGENIRGNERTASAGALKRRQASAGTLEPTRRKRALHLWSSNRVTTWTSSHSPL
jgi:hypothetical protein